MWKRAIRRVESAASADASADVRTIEVVAVVRMRDVVVTQPASVRAGSAVPAEEEVVAARRGSGRCRGRPVQVMGVVGGVGLMAAVNASAVVRVGVQGGGGDGRR